MDVTATIRMYRLDELGDCFLVSFAADGERSHVLIDCGTFRNSARSVDRLRTIVGAIARDLDGARLDVVVGTHQHNDHVNGFLHCKNAFAAIGVDDVWLSWLDDPDDPEARRIGRDFNNVRLQLASARDRLHRARPGARVLGVMNDVLGFFGAPAAGMPPATPADAFAVLERLGRRRPTYLEPGDSRDLPGLPVGAVRVHVLGPPRSKAALLRKDPRKAETYDPHLAATSAMAARYLSAVAGHAGAGSRDEEHFPFNIQFKRRSPDRGSSALRELARRYASPSDRWRSIDDAWLDQGESLALFLDTFTNNSSLVLAFELVESGKVLLFVADAQAGNWASWADIEWRAAGITTDDLLARTVFYKVGHHASHNATNKVLFEKVTHQDLVALIPVHKQDANITKQTNPWRMPAEKLFERLKAKTQGRVLQMDNVNDPDCRPAVDPAKSAWRRVGITPRVTPDSITLQIKG